MLSLISDFFSTVASFFSMVWNAIQWLIDEVVQLVTFAISALAWLGNFVGSLPVVFVAPIMCAITILIVKRVRG